MATHAAKPPSPVETTCTAVLGVYRKHPDGVTFFTSFLFGLMVTADIIVGSILLDRAHHYAAEMGLLLGSFTVAAALAAWVYIDTVRPVESRWDGHQWNDAGKVRKVGWFKRTFSLGDDGEQLAEEAAEYLKEQAKKRKAKDDDEDKGKDK